MIEVSFLKMNAKEGRRGYFNAKEIRSSSKDISRAYRRNMRISVSLYFRTFVALISWPQPWLWILIIQCAGLDLFVLLCRYCGVHQRGYHRSRPSVGEIMADINLQSYSMGSETFH